MTKDLGTLQPLNEEKFFEEFDILEEDARKEKIQSVLKERNETLDYNRKLYSRAKEAEGFKQDEEGNWTKTVEPKAKPVKSDEDLLKRLDTMALRVSGIQAEDEVELFNKWKEQTGRDADAIIGNPIFQKELADARTAKANASATDIKGGGGSSPAKGTLEEQADYWISKSSKDSRGDPLFSDEMPSDYKLHAAIVRKLNESSKDKKKFYNSK